MQLEIGKIYTGKVKGITQYGAFVDIDGGGSGMVHISEIANTFVNEIRDHLTEGQEVKVKVIGINEAGKVSLSIKKAADNDGETQERRPRPAPNKERRSKPLIWEPKKTVPQSEMSFEDMMSQFKQSSEERIGDLKRSTDRKNGTRRK
jgi:S1 RNA binding domain protein